MRIAQIAPLHEAVPPKLYGGTERVVSYLTVLEVRPTEIWSHGQVCHPPGVPDSDALPDDSAVVFVGHQRPPDLLPLGSGDRRQP